MIGRDGRPGHELHARVLQDLVFAPRHLHAGELAAKAAVLAGSGS